MRVVVTGATGYVGSALAAGLAADGHDLVGLARSEAAASSLRARGLDVCHGDLEDLESLSSAAASADAVASEIDAAAISALGAGLADSDRPLVITSATALVSVPGLRQRHVLAIRHLPGSDNRAEVRRFR